MNCYVRGDWCRCDLQLAAVALTVVELQCLLAHVRLQSIHGIWQGRQLERHGCEVCCRMWWVDLECWSDHSSRPSSFHIEIAYIGLHC
jgi:hypothetical protein